MALLRLFLVFIVLFIVILIYRHRVATNLTDRWLTEHRFVGRESNAFKQNINVFVWPVVATIVTIDNEGRRVKIKLVIGTIFGGDFNDKVHCDKIEQLPE